MYRCPIMRVVTSIWSQKPKRIVSLVPAAVAEGINTPAIGSLQRPRLDTVQEYCEDEGSYQFYCYPSQYAAVLPYRIQVT